MGKCFFFPREIAAPILYAKCGDGLPWLRRDYSSKEISYNGAVQQSKITRCGHVEEETVLMLLGFVASPRGISYLGTVKCCLGELSTFERVRSWWQVDHFEKC